MYVIPYSTKHCQDKTLANLDDLAKKNLVIGLVMTKLMDIKDSINLGENTSQQFANVLSHYYLVQF